MSFPAFYGVAGEIPQQKAGNSFVCESGWRLLWNVPCLMKLWVRNAGVAESYCSATPDDGSSLAVFVWGQPLIASDSEFDVQTTVERIPHADLPSKIADLYRNNGTRSFELLEGNFCLVIADAESQEVLLVVDKFGCDDIYLQRFDGNTGFASHPFLLTDSFPQFGAVTTAFFLAQEGFVPAPFTLFRGIETIGRAKLVRIRASASGISVQRERYWHPGYSVRKLSMKETVDEFNQLLDGAVRSRRRTSNAVLLSSGVDSSLLANLMARHDSGSFLTLTGAVRGHEESQLEAERAVALSASLGIAHESVVLDPEDETVPDEWVKCVASWSGGVRATLPLFCGLARRMRDRLGASSGAFSGQMADTLADNNYTLSSLGYTIRRMLFSSWFQQIMPIARVMAPCQESGIGRMLKKAAKICAGGRIGGMAASLLDGLTSDGRFYAGRVFGFGEMPGRSSASCPALSEKGFENIANWYSSSFVTPVVSRLAHDTFYRDMIELSMDMVMLHLDTRLVVHALRLGGGSAELPFLDSRIVKFFASLPYSARAFYRRPKWVIEKQFRRHRYARRGSIQPASSATPGPSRPFEKALLAGSLGTFFRELVARQSLFDTAAGLNEFIDESYFERQLRAFRRGLADVDCKFITRVAALELWSQTWRSESARDSKAAAIA